MILALTGRHGMPFLNAFQSVRPKGADTPHAPVRLPRQSQATGPIALDRNGRPVVPLAPRAASSLVIENAVQSKASARKRQALRMGSI
ncbi:MAG: hypothetical protein JSR53_14240 [Proteobacteria bacterium]|nr:hypothetical protein [Pseudomonadota bacterium]MBS0508530.1 hypothetical protein [Pseudomonadota bacterium]